MSTKGNAARQQARAEAFAFLERVHNGPVLHACCNGHEQCSDSREGRCLDETLIEFPELED